MRDAFCVSWPWVVAQISCARRWVGGAGSFGRRGERAARAHESPQVRPPRYDELFERGVAWLDSLAGRPLSVADGELVVSPDAWKSEGRRGSNDAG